MKLKHSSTRQSQYSCQANHITVGQDLVELSDTVLYDLAHSAQFLI